MTTDKKDDNESNIDPSLNVPTALVVNASEAIIPETQPQYFVLQRWKGVAHWNVYGSSHLKFEDALLSIMGYKDQHLYQWRVMQVMLPLFYDDVEDQLEVPEVGV